MTTKISLPSSCDLTDAAPLRDSILQRRGEDLEIDGSNVERIGALGLQVIASAEQTWRSDGRTFTLTSPSERLLDALALINLKLPETNS